MPPTALFVLLGTLMCSIAATSALGPVGAVCDLTSRNSVLGMSGKEVFVQVQHHEAAVDTTTLQTITTATTQFDFLAPVSAKLGWAIKTFNDTARTQGVLRVDMETLAATPTSTVHAGNTSRVQSLTIGPDGALLVTLSLTSDNTIANDFGQLDPFTGVVDPYVHFGGVEGIAKPFIDTYRNEAYFWTGKNQFSCVNLSNFSVQTLTVPGYTPGSLNYAPPAVVSTKQGRRVFFVRTIVENTSKFILKYRLMCADLDQPGTLLLNISVPVPAWATHDENVLLAPAVSFSGEDFSQSSVFFGLFGLSFMIPYSVDAHTLELTQGAPVAAGLMSLHTPMLAGPNSLYATMGPHGLPPPIHNATTGFCAHSTGAGKVMLVRFA